MGEGGSGEEWILCYCGFKSSWSSSFCPDQCSEPGFTSETDSLVDRRQDRLRVRPAATTDPARGRRQVHYPEHEIK